MQIEVNGKQYRYYILESRVQFDEDELHEYKGHLNFTKDQVPPFAYDAKFDRPSRQPISKLVRSLALIFICQLRYVQCRASVHTESPDTLSVVCYVCCRTLNAFLNSARGGTIYLGVANDGKILGVVASGYKVG